VWGTKRHVIEIHIDVPNLITAKDAAGNATSFWDSIDEKVLARTLESNIPKGWGMKLLKRAHVPIRLRGMSTKQRSMVKHLGQAGFQIDLNRKRVGEDVDKRIHEGIQDAFNRLKKDDELTIVLVSGDGGYLETLGRFAREGYQFTLIVWGWNDCIHRNYQNFANHIYLLNDVPGLLRPGFKRDGQFLFYSSEDSRKKDHHTLKAP
jgi:hypothetical protein